MPIGTSDVLGHGSFGWLVFELFLSPSHVQVIVIQTYFRRWHAINVVMRLKKERKLRLEWEAQEERRKAREKLERLRKEYGRRLYPRTKEDFELLYHALECEFL